MWGLSTLLDRLLSRVDNARFTDQHKGQRDSLVQAAAERLNAVAVVKNDRMVLSRGGVDIEWMFVQFAGRIEKIVWRVTARAPGFPTFDLSNMNDCREPEVLRHVLTDAMMKPITTHRLELRCEANRITARLTPQVIWTGPLDAACELLWELVATDPYATSTLRTLGDYHEGELPYVVVPGPTPVRVGYTRVDQRIVHEARAHAKATPAMIEQAHVLGADMVADGYDLVMRFRRVIRERDILLRAAALLRDVPAEGVFR
jgi:hypothetical protein